MLFIYQSALVYSTINNKKKTKMIIIRKDKKQKILPQAKTLIIFISISNGMECNSSFFYTQKKI